MTTDELKKQAAHLEMMYDNSRPQERLRLRSDVHRVIRSLASCDQPVPRRLSRICRKLDDEAYDDMFENMPV